MFNTHSWKALLFIVFHFVYLYTHCVFISLVVGFLLRLQHLSSNIYTEWFPFLPQSDADAHGGERRNKIMQINGEKDVIQ